MKVKDETTTSQSFATPVLPMRSALNTEQTNPKLSPAQVDGLTKELDEALVVKRGRPAKSTKTPEEPEKKTPETKEPEKPQEPSSGSKIGVARVLG